jgi:hypothetical protein
MTDTQTTPTPDTMSEPMQTDRDANGGGGGWISSPIDDATYNLIMALGSKLEAIDTYRVYADDGQSSLWRELAEDEARHAERLYASLRERMASGWQSSGRSSTSG